MATQQNGLTMLGEAIAGGARDYANRKLSLEDEARRRGNQLQDVQSARDYDQQVYGRRRADQLADVGAARAAERDNLIFSSQMAAAAALVHEGILAPGAMNDPKAVAAAFAEAQRRGLDKIYTELLTTPGPDGRPLLARDMMNNPQAIEAAKSALSQIKASAAKLQLEQPGNAAASIDALTVEGQQVRQQLASLEAKLGESQPTVDQQTVLNRALALARDAKGGKAPSQQEIQAMVGQATSEAQSMALQRWLQDKEDAKIQYQILNARLNNIRQQQSDLTRTFGVAPKASVLAEPVAAAAPAGRGAAATPEQRTAALTAAVRAATGQPPEGAQAAAAASAAGPARAPLLANPTSDPIIARENESIGASNRSAQNRALADPYNLAMDELNNVNQQIARVRGGGSQSLLVPDELSRTTPRSQKVTDLLADPQSVMLDGSAQAKLLSNLLIKQQAVQRELEAKRRAMLGLPAGVTAPTISTPAGSTPLEFAGQPDNWWRQ